jgi:hypothetical protein
MLERASIGSALHFRVFFLRACGPFGAYFGRQYAVISEREKIKKRTMRKRKKEYLAARAA